MPRTDLKLFAAAGLTLDADTFVPDGVRGADKVADRFVYALLTPQGTVPGRPADGSPFLSLVAQFRSEYEVFVAFAGSLDAAAATVRACESAAETSAEKYGAAQLSGVELDGTTVTLILDVRAADGSAPAEPVEFTLDV